jgi:hypothetical protein
MTRLRARPRYVLKKHSCTSPQLHKRGDTAGLQPQNGVQLSRNRRAGESHVGLRQTPFVGASRLHNVARIAIVHLGVLCREGVFGNILSMITSDFRLLVGVLFLEPRSVRNCRHTVIAPLQPPECNRKNSKGSRRLNIQQNNGGSPDPSIPQYACDL